MKYRVCEGDRVGIGSGRDSVVVSSGAIIAVWVGWVYVGGVGGSVHSAAAVFKAVAASSDSAVIVEGVGLVNRGGPFSAFGMKVVRKIKINTALR